MGNESDALEGSDGMEHARRMALRTLGIGLCMVAPDGRVLSADDTFLGMFHTDRSACGHITLNDLGLAGVLESDDEEHHIVARTGMVTLRNRGAPPRLVRVRTLSCSDPDEVQLMVEEIRQTAYGTDESVLLQEMFVALQRKGADILSIHDLEGRILLYEGPPEYGLTPQEMVGRTAVDLLPEGEGERILEQLLSVARTGEEQTFENSVVRDGCLQHFVDFLYPFYDGSGEMIAIGKLNRNVTECREAEQKLRESEARYRAIVQAMPDAMFRRTRDGVCLYSQYADPALQFVLHDEIAGSSMPVCGLPLGIIEWSQKATEDALDTGEMQVFEREISTLNGYRVYEVRVVPSGDDEVLCIMRDMTDRRLMEERLRASETRYRVLYRNAHVGLFRVRLSDGTLIECNERFAEMYGYDGIEDATDRYDAKVHYPEPEDFERIRSEIEIAGVVRDTDVYQRRLDGAEFWADISVTSAENHDTVDGVILDVTAQHEAALDRERLHSVMVETQKLESLGVLAGGVAHHFNNLLQVIMGNADMATIDLPDDSPVYGYVEQIQHATQRATRLSGQLLAYSGKGQMAMTEIDLSRTLSDMEQVLSITVLGRAGLALDLTRPIPPFVGDMAQIGRLIVDIVTNAAEASEGSEVMVTVRTGFAYRTREWLDRDFLGKNLPEGSYVFLEVNDTGSGMDEDTLERIFDPFFSTRHATRGLGLAAVLGTVRGHHGLIEVESELNVGTTCRVHFPAVSSRTRALVEAAAADFEWIPAGTVLLVEDEEIVHSIEKMMLRSLGFRVVSAWDGVEAIELFRKNPDEIRLVVLDMVMPRMNGTQALREIRRIRSDIPVIVSSGYDEKEVSAFFKGELLPPYLQKPFQTSSLKSKIQEVLAGGTSS